MSGEIAIRQLLVGEPDVTDLVPPADEPSRLLVGVLPRDVALPALSIQTARSEERKTITPGATRQVTDLVRVTALAETSDELPALLKAVRKACSHKFPIVEGITRVVVLPRAEGEPMLDEEASVHMKAQDFTVSYSEPR